MNTTNYKKINFFAPALLVCAILVPQLAFAADRYWVGGTGSWSSTAQWAETSGGNSGASVPSAADNCIFDSASNATAYTVTVDTDATCLDLSFAAPGTSGTVTLAGTSSMTVAGNLTTTVAITNDYTGTLTFTSPLFDYLAGTDATGSTASGVGSIQFNNVAVSGNYAYVTSSGNATECSSAAGSAIGCELQVYDISTPSSPTYVAGVDASGSTGSGTGNSFSRIFISGNYAYVTGVGNATECSNTPGSAIGCELKIFDISSSTAPTYVAGIDASGSVGSGTGSAIFNYVAVSGNYAYVTSAGSATACSNTPGSAIGCELKIFDISSPATPTYVAGVDASGSTGSGGSSVHFNGVAVSGNYVYVATAGNSTTCSHTPGSAIGCELKIIDVSTPVSPVYVRGIDIQGLVGSGTLSSPNFNTVNISGDYAYVTTGGSAGLCTTAGAATGCELQIYNIANPLIPFYANGIDATGYVGAGTNSTAFQNTKVSGNYLYIVQNANTDTCSNTPGFAAGCELKIYDISNPATPLYLIGFDATGSAGSGTGSGSFTDVDVSGNYAYMTSTGNVTACSSAAGSAIGCEFKVLMNRVPTPATLSGTLNGSSAFADINFVAGSAYQINSNVSAVDFKAHGAYLRIPVEITVDRDYFGNAQVDFTGSTLNMTNSATERTVPLPVAITGMDVTGFIDSGSSNFSINNLFISGNYLYTAGTASTATCTDDIGFRLGCEFNIYDITNPEVPVHIVAMDSSGSINSGVGGFLTNSVFVSGNYAYLASAGSATLCSSETGSAMGCELRIFDVTNPAAPTYVAGIDSSGYVATGTVQSSMNDVFVSGDYAYVALNGNSTACSNTVGSAIGCEFQIYDVSNPTAPVYIAGADSSGSAGSGTGNTTFNALYVAGNYAYVVSSASGGACSSTAGSASSCELKIFDISSSTAPTLVMGIDASGSNGSGSGSSTVLDVFVSGNYLYTAGGNSATACSNVAGSGIGCEVKIYDVSNPVLPSYIAGIDASGAVGSGEGSVQHRGVYVAGDYLYVAQTADSTACTNVAGTATGCEFKIYDISNPAAPLYVSGADASGKTGTSDGNGTSSFANALAISLSGDYAYVIKSGASNYCGLRGERSGCELLVFDLKPAGVLSGGSLGSVSITGAATTTLLSPTTVSGTFTNSSFIDAQAATSLSVEGAFSNSGTFYSPAALTLGGDYANTGTAVIGTPVATEFDGASAQSLSGTMTGAHAFGSVTFSGTGTKTFVNNASTTAFTIQSGSTVSAPSLLSIDGSYQNSGTLNAQTGNVDFTGIFSGQLLAGVDISGAVGSGTGGANANSVFVSGDYAYIATAGNTTACSNVVGSAIGCEFKIFDISNPSSPLYIAGIDASGSVNSGATSVAFNYVSVSGNYAYVTSGVNTTECSSAADSGIGCELKIFDISSSTAPTYVAGVDSTGSIGSGAGGVLFNGLAVSGNYAYVTSSLSTTECSSAADSGIGCELKIFDISSSTAPTYVAGVDSTGTVGSGAGGSSFFNIRISGNYAYIGAGINATECSNVVGSAIGCEFKIFDISNPSSPLYIAGIDASGSVGSGTAANANFNGTVKSGNYVYLISSGITTECSNIAESAIGCELKVYDVSNPASPTFVVGVDSSGSVGFGTGSSNINSISLSDNYIYITSTGANPECHGSVGNANGCELKIFDISSSTAPLYIAGIDSTGFVNAGTGGTGFLNVEVSGNYGYITSSSSFPNCSSTPGSTSGCELRTFVVPQRITGTLTADSSLYGANVSGKYLFSSNASTTNLSIESGGSLVAPALLDIAGNYENEGTFDANTGTVYLSGTGNTAQTLSGTLDDTSAFYNLTVSNTASSILFTATTSVTNIFTMLPSTSAQFLAGATSTFQQIDWQGTSGDPISLLSTEPDSSWSIAVPGSRTLSYVRVKDSNACSGESDLNGGTGSVNLGNNFCWTLEITPVFLNAGAAVGGNAPAGQGTVGGGSGSGGIDIGGLPGFFAPTNSGSASGFSTGWTSLTNAYLSDNSRASATTQAASDFYGFGFNIPSGDQVTGIAVRLEGSSDTGAGTIRAELSWNAGVSTTTSNIVTTTLGNTDDVYALGSDATLWGRSWVPTEFSDANFRLRLIGVPSNNTIFLDAIQVKIIHHASGGSGSGGGEI